MQKSSGWVGRALRALPVVLHVSAAALLGLGGTGCGALAALTNPDAAWAFNEPAPMSVVVRRAELAHATAEQVERLMGQTPVDDDSSWIPETSLKKDEAQALLTAAGTNDTYGSAQGQKLRVTAAEAYVTRFSTICSDEDQHPSLLAATSPKLQSSYEDIARIQDEIGRVQAKVGDVDKALEKEGIADADKEKLEKEKAGLEDQIEKLEESYDPKVEDFVKLVREEAAKLDDAKKKSIGVAVVNLRRAVEEAKNNNSVALLRYPIAVTGLTGELEPTAKRVVADVIEEKVGKRPDMTSLKPEVKLEGTDVKLTLNGLTPSELASLSPDELLEEATLRLGSYVGRVAILIGYADETQRVLEFQSQVLDAWLEGMKIDSATFAGAGESLAELKVESGPAAGQQAKKVEIDRTKLGRFMPGGVRTSACSRKVKAKPAEEETEVAAAPEPKKGKSDKKPAPAKPGKSAQKDQKAPAKPPSKSGTGQGPTVPVKSEAPAGGPATSDPGRCDIVVTTAEGSTCM